MTEEKRLHGVRPDRVLAMLRDLRELTGDKRGAQRVAWTNTWRMARAFLSEQLQELPVTVETDAAANLWARLPGGDGGTVVIGSHLDSVPGGGWLDGAYGVMCALEVLRALSRREPLPCSVALVDWADEEGARFGCSLFGSSAVAGTLDVAAVRGLTDTGGLRLGDAVRDYGVALDDVAQARRQIQGVRAYLEAHIEQGPVLEAEKLAVAAVSGTVGIERHRLTFRGQASHAGSTPMPVRRDAFLAAASTALAVRDSAVRHGGTGTVGSVLLQPGVVTAVAGEAVILVDQRHLDKEALRAMLQEVQDAARHAAVTEGCEVTSEAVFRAPPQAFADELVTIVRDVCQELTGVERIIPSWALHDATQMARVVPTAMLFTSSLNGLSHDRAEDTPEEHLKLGVEVFYRVVENVIGVVREADS